MQSDVSDGAPATYRDRIESFLHLFKRLSRDLAMLWTKLNYQQNLSSSKTVTYFYYINKQYYYCYMDWVPQTRMNLYITCYLYYQEHVHVLLVLYVHSQSSLYSRFIHQLWFVRHGRFVDLISKKYDGFSSTFAPMTFSSWGFPEDSGCRYALVLFSGKSAYVYMANFERVEDSR